MPRRSHIPSLLCLLSVVLGVTWPPGPVLSQNDDPGRIMVYLEVPREVATPTTLSLAALLLGDGDRLVRLDPLERNLANTVLAGRQVLLADAEVPVGLYDRLVFVLTGVTTTVGRATVTPEVRGQGYELALNEIVEAGGCLAVFIRWRPSQESGRDQPYVPSLAILGRRVPPLGSLALVTCRGTGSLVAIDRNAGRVVDMVRLGEDPRDVVYVRGQQKIIVALAGEDALAVVNGLSLRLERKVPLRFGDEPDRMALSEELGHLYILNPGSRTLSVLGIGSLQERFRIAVGEGPRSLAVDTHSGYVYVACEGEGQVQVIDSASGALVSALTPTLAPREVIVDGITRQLFLSSSSQRRIYTYDLAEGKESGSLTICGTAIGLDYNSRTRQVFASLPDCREVAVVRPDLGLEFSSLAMPAAPDRLVLDPEYRQLLVLFARDGMLAVCNPHRGNVESLLKVGANPYAVVTP